MLKLEIKEKNDVLRRLYKTVTNLHQTYIQGRCWLKCLLFLLTYWSPGYRRRFYTGHLCGQQTRQAEAACFPKSSLVRACWWLLLLILLISSGNGWTSCWGRREREGKDWCTERNGVLRYLHQAYKNKMAADWNVYYFSTDELVAWLSPWFLYWSSVWSTD